MTYHFMKKLDRWTVGGLLVGLLVVIGLSVAAATEAPAGTTNTLKPAKVEAIAGSQLKKVTLTEDAAGRLGLQTVAITGAGTAKTMPYAALMYLPNGTTWAYMEVAPLSFVREPVTVSRIDGDKVLLSQGPPAGTKVVSVGAAELYGAETGLGK
jgi:hypothetical protein